MDINEPNKTGRDFGPGQPAEVGGGLSSLERDQLERLSAKAQAEKERLDSAKKMSEDGGHRVETQLVPDEMRKATELQGVDSRILNHPDTSKEAAVLRGRIEKINALLSGKLPFTEDKSAEVVNLAMGLDDEEKPV